MQRAAAGFAMRFKDGSIALSLSAVEAVAAAEEEDDDDELYETTLLVLQEINKKTIAKITR